MEDNNIFEQEPQWKPGSAPVSEIRKIQKTIRSRNRKIISISVVLAAVLLVVSVFGIIPWAESLYWNPDETTYRDATDLKIALDAYTELFNPGYHTSWVTYQHTGFASYKLEILLRSTAQGEMLSVGGSLERNNLHMDEMFLFPDGKDYPIHKSGSGDMPPPPSETEALREKLSSLPEYVCLEATVSFSEELSMEELVKFMTAAAMDPITNNMDITWVAVDGGVAGCGMSVDGGQVYPLVDLDYRCFSGPADWKQESLEHHVTSLLRYSADQVEKGRGIAPYGHESVYTEILDYVEENGIKTYGVVVTASPQALLKLMDNDLIYDIRLIDGWVDIG